jgi:hypothetical protein
MRLAFILLAIAPLLFLSACSSTDASSSSADTALSPMLERRPDGVIIASAESLRKLPGYVVDSIFPPEEALRRFRLASGPEQPTELTGGATTIKALFEAYVKALAARDSIAVLQLALTRAEYAWLYYDKSPEQASGLVPQAAWGLMESRSNTGLGRAASRVSGLGSPARVVSASCANVDAEVPGAELLGRCVVEIEGGRSVRTTLPLARLVMRRNGRVKLVSFANDL